MQQWLYLILIFGIFSSPMLLSAQCENQIHYPIGILVAPAVQEDTLVISETQFAGDYSKVSNIVSGIIYVVTSSTSTDYITIRTSDTSAVIAHGSTPLTFVPTSSGTVTIHINLTVPSCGTENTNRITTISNQGVFVNIGHFGIKTNTPTTALDVAGKVRLSDDLHAETKGVIRWNESSQDFEGYDGIKWRSLTMASSTWGELLTPKVSENKKVIQIEDDHWFFAKSMAIDGQTVIVNATSSDNGVNGRALIYENINDDSTEIAELYEPSAAPANVFASGEVDINNDRAIVGTIPIFFQGAFTHGSVTVYNRVNDIWTMETVLAPDTLEGSFGHQVSIDESYIAVSAGWSKEVYVYTLQNDVWSKTQEVGNHINDDQLGFGSEIQIHNNRLFISAPGNLFNLQGKVYIYELDGNGLFVLEDSITSPSNPSNGFGDVFKADGDHLIVGSPQQYYNNEETRGLAAIYHKNAAGWQLESVLDSPTDEYSYRFGLSVDIDGDQLVVGTSGIEKIFQNSHIAYRYIKIDGEWILNSKLRPSDHGMCFSYGDHIAIDGSTIIVGDWHQRIDRFEYGALYVFNKF